MTIEELVAALRDLLAAAEAEGRDLTEEEAERASDLNGKIEAAKKTAEVQKRSRELLAPVNPGVSFAAPKHDDGLERAFEHFLRTGQVNADIVELRAQGVGTGAAGGFTVPEGFRAKIVERMKEFGGIANAAEVITTDSGQDLPWVTNDDTANLGEIVAEAGTFAAGADLVFGSKTLGAFKYSAGGASNLPLKVSVELLQDSAFNVSEFVARKLGERIARAQAADWAVGAGTTEPTGLLSAAGGLATGVTIATNATGPTYAELVDIVHSLDPAYRANASWVFNDAQLAKARKLLDADNRPLLWDAGMNMGSEPGGLRLLGYPVIVDQACPDPAASNEFGAFGDIRAAYVIRRVKDVQIVVLHELYAANGQVGFMAWARADGTVQDANAAKLITAAA